MATQNSTFAGKVVIVTGSSAGLGKTIALMYAARGASVCLCGRNQEKLNQSQEACIQASGGHKDRIISFTGDVNDGNVRKQIVEGTVSKFGRLDILVPNAGTAIPDSGPSTATEGTYDAVMDTNLKSVFFLVQTALPHLTKTKGNIVMISSIFSVMPGGVQAIYAMSKAAIDSFVKTLAVSEGPNGVRTNSVNPSFVPTELTRNLAKTIGVKAEIISQAFADKDAQNHPLEGRCLRSDEVAEAVLFLSSDAASFITGQNLLVDGGRHFQTFDADGKKVAKSI